VKVQDAHISGFELLFLFRTAFRAPVIKYIASTSASQVASVVSRDAYQDHTDFAGLLFELFEACHGSKSCACLWLLTAKNSKACIHAHNHSSLFSTNTHMAKIERDHGATLFENCFASLFLRTFFSPPSF